MHIEELEGVSSLSDTSKPINRVDADETTQFRCTNTVFYECDGKSVSLIRFKLHSYNIVLGVFNSIRFQMRHERSDNVNATVLNNVN